MQACVHCMHGDTETAIISSCNTELVKHIPLSQQPIGIRHLETFPSPLCTKNTVPIVHCQLNLSNYLPVDISVTHTTYYIQWTQNNLRGKQSEIQENNKCAFRNFTYFRRLLSRGEFSRLNRACQDPNLRCHWWMTEDVTQQILR